MVCLCIRYKEKPWKYSLSAALQGETSDEGSLIWIYKGNKPNELFTESEVFQPFDRELKSSVLTLFKAGILL